MSEISAVPGGLSRRRALAAVAAAALGVAGASAAVACSSDDSGGAAGPTTSDRSTTTVPPPFWPAIAAQARTDDPSLTADSAARELGLDPAAMQDPTAVAPDRVQELAARVRDDFAAGRTVPVAGWLLARTEVLLAVVADGTHG